MPSLHALADHSYLAPLPFLDTIARACANKFPTHKLGRAGGGTGTRPDGTRHTASQSVLEMRRGTLVKRRRLSPWEMLRLVAWLVREEEEEGNINNHVYRAVALVGQGLGCA